MLKDYEIPYTGLKVGKHHFKFEIGDKFFEAFEYSEIDRGNLVANVELEKQSTMMVLNFKITGTINTLCDRCTEPINVPVNAKERLIVKFGDEPFEDTDEIMVLPQSEHKVKLAQALFEYIELNMPQKRLHEKGLCNQEMITRLQDHMIDEGEEIDPRWAALKALKNN